MAGDSHGFGAARSASSSAIVQEPTIDECGAAAISQQSGIFSGCRNHVGSRMQQARSWKGANTQDNGCCCDDCKQLNAPGKSVSQELVT